MHRNSGCKRRFGGSVCSGDESKGQATTCRTRSRECSQQSATRRRTQATVEIQLCETEPRCLRREPLPVCDQERDGER